MSGPAFQASRTASAVRRNHERFEEIETPAKSAIARRNRRLPRRPPSGSKTSKPRDQLLGIKVARQGKFRSPTREGGLKSCRHDFPVRLQCGPVGTAIEITKGGAHFAADTKGGV